jgi:hypothetical protein
MRETLFFVDEPAPAVIAAAVTYLQARGLAILHRAAYSVSFAAGAWGPTPAAGAGRTSDAAAAAAPGPTGAGQLSGAAGGRRRPGGERSLQPGTGQIAAVPIQRRPEWSRVWVTVNDTGAAATAAAAYVEVHRERSRRVERAVQQLERDIYDEAQWPAYEATLRASLQQHGVGADAIEARIAAFKRRWSALGRKAASAPPEERPPTA